MHTQFLKTLPQNAEYVQTHCNERNIPFRFVVRKWYIYIITHIVYIV